MSGASIVWLRQDLRLRDNPALRAAAEAKRPIALLYILDDETPGRWKLGGAARWWLHHSLAALDQDARKMGLPLILRRGSGERALRLAIEEAQADAVFWNRCYEPYAIARDAALKESLAQTGVEVATFNGSLLCEPWTIKTKPGEPFKVYSPFTRACLRKEWRAPTQAPSKAVGLRGALASDQLASWNLLPTRPNWAEGFEPVWRPGEAGAHVGLESFIAERLHDYASGRDRMGAASVSRLSPHLHFGELSPAQARASVEAAAARDHRFQSGAEKFLSELLWREFSANLLYHWPSLPTENWRASFDAFPWRDDEVAFNAWTRGATGYPIVDAAMRELWATGYVHNRARMVAASFLVKHLLIDWRRGAEWFWDTLVDADLANNSASWQWVAGSGADAAPYFRIFNPVLQGERFDADGAYVRRWVPELARLPNAFLHKPWSASASALADAGIALGVNYPLPIVDHDVARQRALAAFATLPAN